MDGWVDKEPEKGWMDGWCVKEGRVRTEQGKQGGQKGAEQKDTNAPSDWTSLIARQKHFTGRRGGGAWGRTGQRTSSSAQFLLRVYL